MMKRQYFLAFAALLFSGAVQAQQSNRIEAESFVDGNGPTRKETKEGITIVGKFPKGKWIKLAGVDFGSAPTAIKVRIASGASEKTPAGIEFRLGSEKGEIIGEATVKSKGWNKFQGQNIPISKASGTQDLFIVSKDGGIVLDWIEIVK